MASSTPQSTAVGLAEHLHQDVRRVVVRAQHVPRAHEVLVGIGTRAHLLDREAEGLGRQALTSAYRRSRSPSTTPWGDGASMCVAPASSRQRRGGSLLGSPMPTVCTALGHAQGDRMRKWQCIVCGWIYDEAEGFEDDGIPPGTSLGGRARGLRLPGVRCRQGRLRNDRDRVGATARPGGRVAVARCPSATVR